LEGAWRRRRSFGCVQMSLEGLVAEWRAILVFVDRLPLALRNRID
jgi:hypothetical protein